MLRRLGHDAVLCICDNGSTDGTQDDIRALESQLEIPHRFILNTENLGNSIARNQIIDYMRDIDADYVLFMDGDIEVVPFSSFAMLRYMESNGERLGCIGADSAGQSPQRKLISPCHFSIDGGRIDTSNIVAWTQYGLFRRQVFDAGIRFDESPPFNGAGWGFEDNDLAFQMDTRGFILQRFFGMTYLHRDRQSSVRNMRSTGIDAHALCQKRQQYVIHKWSSIPHINNGPLSLIRRMHFRL